MHDPNAKHWRHMSIDTPKTSNKSFTKKKALLKLAMYPTKVGFGIVCTLHDMPDWSPCS